MYIVYRNITTRCELVIIYVCKEIYIIVTSTLISI